MEVSGFAMDDTAYRVLIIDDELSLLKSLVAFFEDEGFFVRGAESGEEGLEILKMYKMNAVIIDLRLPGIDGNETIVRAHELQPALRFLIHTGSTDYQIPPLLRRIGIEQEVVFLKPLPDLSVLSEAVRALFR
jgi:two-component system OmpR family response regulator